MTVIEWVQFIVLVVAIVLSITLFIFVLVKSIREGFTRNRTAIFVLALGLLFITYLTYNRNEILPADWAQIMLVLGLVSVTGIYALFTARQARASVRMAEEMRQQTIMASQPLIILRAARTESIPSELSQEYFELYNARNGPAIDVQVVLLDQWKKPLNGQRKEFLRAGETMEFYTDLPLNLNGCTFYVVSEYQGILSRNAEETWYQTWLPCKLSVSGKIISGKLEFYEVLEDKRIGIFKTEFNNGDKHD